MTHDTSKISLRDIFLGLQESMSAKLTLNRRTLHHPVAKGDASELEWKEMLATYLPKRYSVDRAFVIDYKGEMSQQIDLVIFDRHYSPFLFRQNGQTFVPAESVYAILEVKQELNKQHIDYAAKKIKSVRQLTRTSGRIVDRGNLKEPRPLPQIIGGVLCLSGNVTPTLQKVLLSLKSHSRIDLGCSLEGSSFVLDETNDSLSKSKKEDSLVFFFLNLLAKLQSMGTIPPMEIDKYIESLVD